MGWCGLTDLWGGVVSQIYGVVWSHGLAATPTSQQIGQFPPKRVKYQHRHPFFFFFLPHSQESSLCSQPIRGKFRRTGRIFPEHVERSYQGSMRDQKIKRS